MKINFLCMSILKKIIVYIISILRKRYFFEKIHTRDIFRTSISLISSLVMLFFFSSCGTIIYAYNGFKCPVYFDINSSNLANTQFFLDGKPMKCEMVEFSASKVGSGSMYNTYSVTSKPAIKINPVHKYYTLTIKNEQYGQKDILLKRTLREGTTWLLIGDLYLTNGIGTLIDVLDNSLMSLPSLDIDALTNNTNTTIFYNTKVETTDK